MSLNPDPKKRPTCSQLLAHPFLNEKEEVENRDTVERIYPSL